MSNIRIRSLPQLSQDKTEYVFSDLHLDLNLEFTETNNAAAVSEKKDTQIDYDLNAIRNSIQNIFLTSPGEKILNPVFGSDLRDFLFMPINETTSRLISDRIAFNIRAFEPRARLVAPPTVTSNPDSNEYTVNFSIQVPSLDNSQIYFLGTLNNQGYVTFE